jgi:hypothetical protein
MLVINMKLLTEKYLYKFNYKIKNNNLSIAYIFILFAYFL